MKAISNSIRSVAILALMVSAGCQTTQNKPTSYYDRSPVNDLDEGIPKQKPARLGSGEFNFSDYGLGQGIDPEMVEAAFQMEEEKSASSIHAPERIAQEVATNCSTGYVHAIPGMRNMNKIKNPMSVEVLRIVNSDDGWVKAWVKDGMIDGNIYYHLEKNTVICGDINWKKYSGKGTAFNKLRKIEWVTITPTPQAPKATVETGVKSDFRPIAVSWEGYDKMFAGKIKLKWQGRNGELKITLPDGEGTCSGAYQFGSDRKGMWSVACTNGLAASGAMQGYGSGNGSSGEGADIKGRKVTFTMGGG